MVFPGQVLIGFGGHAVQIGPGKGFCVAHAPPIGPSVDDRVHAGGTIRVEDHAAGGAKQRFLQRRAQAVQHLKFGAGILQPCLRLSAAELADLLFHTQRGGCFGAPRLQRGGHRLRIEHAHHGPGLERVQAVHAVSRLLRRLSDQRVGIRAHPAFQRVPFGTTHQLLIGGLRLRACGIALKGQHIRRLHCVQNMRPHGVHVLAAHMDAAQQIQVAFSAGHTVENAGASFLLRCAAACAQNQQQRQRKDGHLSPSSVHAVSSNLCAARAISSSYSCQLAGRSAT